MTEAKLRRLGDVSGVIGAVTIEWHVQHGPGESKSAEEDQTLHQNNRQSDLKHVKKQPNIEHNSASQSELVSWFLSFFSVRVVTVYFNSFAQEFIITLMSFEEVESIGTHLLVVLGILFLAPCFKRLVSTDRFENRAV